MDKTAVTVSSFDATADAYERKLMDCSLYEEALRLFAGLLPHQAKLLDLGCGPGNVARRLLGLRSDLVIAGVDMSPEMIKRFRANVPTASAQVLDLRDLHTLEQRFDAAVASFCLPFLTDQEAEGLLDTVAGLLSPGGALYLATMRGSGHGFEKTSFGGEREFFFNYYERSTLDRLLANAGFEILAYREQIYPQQTAPDLTDMIYLARRRAGSL